MSLKTFHPYKRMIAIMLTISFVFFGTFSFAPKAEADCWGCSMVAEMVGISLEQILQMIKDMVIAALKQAAVEMVNEQVNNLISGGGMEGSMFITDWQDFLVDQPITNTEIYLNDFFSMTTGGRSSVSNYLSGAEGILGNYTSYLQESAMAEIIGSVPEITINEYSSDATQMFTEGNWRAFNSFISNPVNNPFGYTLSAKGAYLSRLEKEKDKALTKAIAYQGYKAGGDGGDLVSTPGSLIKDIQAQVADIGNKALASSESIPGVIVSMVTKIVTSYIKQGVGGAKGSIQKEVNGTVGKYKESLKNRIPSQVYKPSY